MGVHDGHRQNMRQRFLNSGLDAFADHEILEMLLFYAIPRKNTNLIAHELIEDYGSLKAVLNASPEDLMLRDGIGENAAVLLTLLVKVVHRMQTASYGRNFQSLKMVCRYLVDLFKDAREERVYQLCFDYKKTLLLCRRLGTGDAASTCVNMRTLVKNALYTRADSVIIAHNHPNGDVIPSPEDYAMTDCVKQVLESVNIWLWDHVIVSGEQYASLRQSGYLS